MRDFMLKVVKLMRWWNYDHTRGVWHHKHHKEVAVTSELLALLLLHTVAAADELKRTLEKEQSQSDVN